jgi:hypothetical protein
LRPGAMPDGRRHAVRSPLYKVGDSLYRPPMA